jgi:hypothetical protein
MNSQLLAERLFDEYLEARSRGERPDVAALLGRAGPAREELGLLIDATLRTTPAAAPTEEQVVLLEARLEGQPPILMLRTRRRLTSAAVVEALVGDLGLDPAKTAKVGGYYHELETGLLPTAGVDASVWDALREVFGANVRALASRAAPAPLLASSLFLRESNVDYDQPAPASAMPYERGRGDVAPEPDEVDRLFGVDPSD